MLVLDIIIPGISLHNCLLPLLQGWKNIILYFVAFLVSLVGQVMDGLSKETIHCHNSTAT